MENFFIRTFCNSFAKGDLNSVIDFDLLGNFSKFIISESLLFTKSNLNSNVILNKSYCFRFWCDQKKGCTLHVNKGRRTLNNWPIIPDEVKNGFIVVVFD